MNFQPLHDRVLVERIPAPEIQRGVIHLPSDPGRAASAQLAEGIVIAIGPGKYDNDGDFIATTVKPGERVLFNARWNDFSHGELKGSDCDGNGPLERPLPIGHDPLLHLIQEADIAWVWE